MHQMSTHRWTGERQRERQRKGQRTLGNEEAEEGGAWPGEWTERPSCSSSPAASILVDPQLNPNPRTTPTEKRTKKGKNLAISRDRMRQISFSYPDFSVVRPRHYPVRGGRERGRKRGSDGERNSAFDSFRFIFFLKVRTGSAKDPIAGSSGFTDRFNLSAQTKVGICRLKPELNIV